MPDREFLCVNAFLRTELDARAIKSAMDLGLIDALAAGQPLAWAAWARGRQLNPRGMALLMDMLETNGVLVRDGDAAVVTQAFQAALRFRDLLESRIAFADLVWPDIHHLFTELLTDVPRFMERSAVFNLFRYDRCFDVNEENLAATAAWTRFTTCLTKYEAGAAFERVSLESVGRFVDFGGNTGEFALQACRRNAALEAVVIDLPVVCALGQRHLATAERACAERVRFFPCDMRRDELPPPADLVSFKSVLHDWPDADAERLLERALSVVRPGGRLMIFERAPIEMAGRAIPYCMAADLVFLHFLRPAEFYMNTLDRLGFTCVTPHRIELDMAFHLIVAERQQ